MADAIFYSFRRCPYAMRARLALRVSGQHPEIREVKLSNKPQAMLDISPKGTVPVLRLGNDEVIEQSLDIMRWALAQNDPENWLARDDAKLIARNDGEFKRDLDRYKYPNRHDSDAEAHRAAGLGFLAELERRLAGQGHGQELSQGQAQLAGSQRGLVDMAIMPFVRQFAAVDQPWFAAQDLPHVQAWLAGHLSSDLFASIMMRLSPWAEGDAPIYFGDA